MASVRLSSSTFCSIEPNLNGVRDDSFASYLAHIRQSFSNELGRHAPPRRSSFKAVAGPMTAPPEENGELDVFGAEKYFNGSLDVQHYFICHELKQDKAESTRSGTRSPSSTYSETSANSYSILLRSQRLRPPQQQQQQRCQRPRRRRSFLDVFRCHCASRRAAMVEDEGEANGGFQVVLQKRSSPAPGSSSSGGVRRNDPNWQLQSEPSSDLFEIDSVSMNSHPVYEPSEASIEWSVATASAANLSAVSRRLTPNVEGKARRRSLGLFGLGCTSQRAVGLEEEEEKVGELERYRVVMGLDRSATVGRTVAARPRRASLEFKI